MEFLMFDLLDKVAVLRVIPAWACSEIWATVEFPRLVRIERVDPKGRQVPAACHYSITSPGCGAGSSFQAL